MAYQSKHTGKQIDDGIDAVGSKLGRTDDLTNNVVTFVEAEERAEIASGETTGTLFGKILKWLKSLGKTALSNDYNDLDNKPTIPSEYELPVATADTLGGIKIGTGLSISNGVVSATGTGGGVTSVNGQTGAVTISVPEKLSDLEDDIKVITLDTNSPIEVDGKWYGSQEAYEAIATLDANTEYNIIEE